MLTDIASLSGKEFKVLGIPQLKVGNMKSYCTESFPRASALANAWDREIWRLTAEEKLCEMAKDKINLAIAPGPKVKLSPYRRELSEDPFLAGEVSAEYARASGCAASAFSGYYLAASEIGWLDKEPNERSLNDFLISPYRRASKKASVTAVLSDERDLSAGYDGVSSRLVCAAEDFASRFTLCERATEENTVKLISQKIICLSGSANALEGAIVKYKKTMTAIERNGLALEESLREDERLFLAISPQKIDEAVDNLLDFVFSCNENKLPSRESSIEDVSMRATLESSVLLKNEKGLLPLNKGERVAVVGTGGYVDADGNDVPRACKLLLDAQGVDCIFAGGGYNTENPEDNSVANARTADVIVVFLGFGTEDGKAIAKRESLVLPPDQLRLLDSLASTNKRIVAVLSSSHTPDVEFAVQTDALLLAPMDTVCSAEAIVRILSGEYNPTGRLASTLYAGSDVAFSKRRYYLNSGMKVGPFVGYRYYDTAEMNLGYPFGHGLSYTTFRYSNLSVSEGRVSFTVTNVGKVYGAEVAQVYAGKIGSAVIRPRKELVGFERVALAPGKSQKVVLNIEYPEVYCDGTLLTEGGRYRVYVGSSVSDIKLSESVEVHGERIEADGERLSDYLQTCSNVLEDNYTLEANYKAMKRSPKNIISGIISIVIALSLAAFNAISGTSSQFIGVIAGILAVFSIYFFIMDGVEKNKQYAAYKESVDEANSELFADADQVSSVSADKLFGDLFDGDDQSLEEAVKSVSGAQEDLHLEYIDTAFTLRGAVEEFERFATEKGYKLAENDAAGLFSALATSKLLVSSGMPTESFNAMVVLMTEYFGSESYIGSAADASSGHGEEDSRDNAFLSALPFALKNALEAPERIHIVALDGLDAECAAEVVKPFTRYISCAKNYNEITITNAENTTASYTIPANLWIFINLRADAKISDLPISFARSLAYNGVSLINCPAADEVSLVHGLNRYQLEYILDKEAKCEVPEELWKKVDKLEKYVADHAEYQIGNKLWLNFEKHIALLVSCGIALPVASDAAIAVRLLPSMTVSLDGNLADDDKNLVETLDFIFGDDNTGKCREFISAFERTGSAAPTKSDVADTAEEQV